MNHITVIASILAIAVSLAASADKPAQCAATCKDAAKVPCAEDHRLDRLHRKARPQPDNRKVDHLFRNEQSGKGGA